MAVGIRDLLSRGDPNRLERAFDDAPLMTLSLDGDGAVVRASPYFLQRISRDRDAVIGKSLSTFLTAESRGVAANIIWPGLESSGHVVDIDLALLADDGEIIEVALLALAIRDRSGRIARVFIVLFEDGARKKIMEGLANQRYAAERASAAKSRMLSEFGCEMQTQLKSFEALLQRMLEDKLTEAQQKRAELLLGAQEMMAVLVGDLIALAESDKAAIELDKSEIGLAEFANEIAATWRARLTNRGAALSVDIDAAAPESFITDARRLRQLIDRLISEAEPLFHGAAPELKISVAERDGAENKLTFALHFSAPANADALAAAGRDDEPRYSGADQEAFADVARALGARRTTSTTPDGTKIYSLEIGLDLPGAARKTKGEKDDEAERRVLAVDDNPINRNLMAAILSRTPYPFDVVNDGDEAVEAARKRFYNLILMDLQMPRMSGVEACREIRKIDPAYETVPIVAVTANAMAGDRERYLSQGLDDFLSKPFAPSAVIDIVEKAMRKALIERRA